MNMTEDAYNVVMAAYLKVDAATTDFDRLVKLVAEKGIKTSEGVILVEHDADGQVHVNDAADHHGRKGLAWGGGVGLVAGLFAPPLLATVAVGAAAGGLIGKFTKHRIETGIEAKVGEALPVGWAGVITLVNAADTAAVNSALPGAVKTTTVPVEGHRVKDLKPGLAEAAQSAKSAS
jgi:uncharacterized membrane protein